MKHVYFISLLFIICSCHDKSEVDSKEILQEESLFSDTAKSKGFPSYELSERIPCIDNYFIDSTEIAIPGKFKIEITELGIGEWKGVAIVHFYRMDKSWKLVQKIGVPKGTRYCYVELQDMNGDGYKDLLIESEEAARGSNSLRSLLVFQPEENRLNYIHNSSYYPNLRYNERTKGITSMAFHGTAHTWFLEYSADSLVKIALVEALPDGGTIVERFDENGEIESSRTINKDYPVYTFFTNYHPVDDQ